MTSLSHFSRTALGYIYPWPELGFLILLFNRWSRPLLSSLSICEGDSKSNRAKPNLATPLDSPPSGTSDPRRKFIDSRGKRFEVLFQIFVDRSLNAVVSRENALFIDSRGKRFEVLFQIFVDRSLNAVVSRENALGNHHFIHPRTHIYDLTTFCWTKHLVSWFCALGRHPSVVPTLCW
jgi:hypothetical protein